MIQPDAAILATGAVVATVGLACVVRSYRTAIIACLLGLKDRVWDLDARRPDGWVSKHRADDAPEPVEESEAEPAREDFAGRLNATRRKAEDGYAAADGRIAMPTIEESRLTRAEVEHQGADEAYAALLHDLREDIDRDPGLTGDALPNERHRAAIQSATVTVAVLTHEDVASRSTATEFDEALLPVLSELDAKFEQLLRDFGVDDVDRLHALTALSTGGRVDATREFTPDEDTELSAMLAADRIEVAA
jgi:hypothetical protein